MVAITGYDRYVVNSFRQGSRLENSRLENSRLENSRRMLGLGGIRMGEGAERSSVCT